MNIALSSIIIIFIFLPGIIFRRSYYSSPFSYRYISTNILFDIANAILPAFILHSIFIGISRLFYFEVNYYTIEKLFGKIDYSLLESPFIKIGDYLGWILLYNILICIIAFLLGHVSRVLVISCDLDKKWDFLKFNNPWYYTFSARALEDSFISDVAKQYNIPEDKLKIDDDLIIYLDLLVDSSAGLIIYKGILVEYILAKSESLESIKLTEVEKEKFQFKGAGKWDNQIFPEKEGKKIPGKYVIIPYDKIINMNVRYIYYIEENYKS